MKDRVIEILPGERLVVRLPAPVGAVYTIEASEFPGHFDIMLRDEVNDEVLDENTFLLEA